MIRKILNLKLRVSHPYATALNIIYVHVSKPLLFETPPESCDVDSVYMPFKN